MEGKEEYQFKTISSNWFCLHAYTSTLPQTSQRRWTGNTELFLSSQELGTSQRNSDAVALRQTITAFHKVRCETVELTDTNVERN